MRLADFLWIPAEGWIAIATVVLAVLTGIYVWQTGSMAEDAKESARAAERAARAAEHALTISLRDDAYTRLLLALRIQRDALEDYAFMGANLEDLEEPDRDELAWVSARIDLVGSDEVRSELYHLNDLISLFWDHVQKATRIRIEDLRGEFEHAERVPVFTAGPDGETEEVEGAFRMTRTEFQVRADIQTTTAAVDGEIRALEELLRSELNAE